MTSLSPLYVTAPLHLYMYSMCMSDKLNFAYSSFNNALNIWLIACVQAVKTAQGSVQTAYTHNKKNCTYFPPRGLKVHFANTSLCCVYWTLSMQRQQQRQRRGHSLTGRAELIGRHCFLLRSIVSQILGMAGSADAAGWQGR